MKLFKLILVVWEMKLRRGLRSNLFYYFLYSLSQRRHFIPILSIYFLTLPNTTAQQIGFYTGLGYLASFLLEIPSSYMADTIGHKKTLIMAKILMIASMLCFIFANGFIIFALGSVFISASFAFTSGTESAFMHNTLIALRKGKKYTKIMSKNSANVSFLSAILIILLPLTTQFDITIPLYINLIFDLLGFGAVLLLTSPPLKKEVKEYEGTFQTLRRSINKSFFPVILFTGLVGGFLIGESGFRYPYLQSLGYPVVLIGLVMGISRFVWFGVGHYAHFLNEKIGIRRLMQIEIILFPLAYLLIASLKNPFLIGAVFSLAVGYYWGRHRIIEHHILDKCVINGRYKATILSVAQQVQVVYEVIVAFGIGFVMQKSYALGFALLGIVLFISMLVIYPFAHKHLRTSKNN